MRTWPEFLRRRPNRVPDSELTEAELKQVQAVQKELLSALLDRCAELELSMVAVAGTALGAVRHGDVIPWDDDIDVGLLRSEYKVLLKSLIDRPIDGAVFQSHETEPAYPFAFAKLRKLNTRVFGDVLDELPISQGIYVDIFPIDFLPSARLARFCQMSALRFFRLVVFSADDFVDTARSTAVRLSRRTLAPLCSRIPNARLKRSRDWVSEWPVTKRSTTTVSFEMYGLRGASRTHLDRDLLFPPKWTAFGETTIPVPNDADSYLTAVFGDYKALPPSSEQRPSHLRKVEFGPSISVL